MNKFLSILAVIIVILGVLLPFTIGYSLDNSDSYGVGNATLNVSSEGPVELSKIIDEIKTHECFEGYDNETVKWMESLGDKDVFFGDGIYVVMSHQDADKIPSEYATDVSINEIFSCEIVEKHSLGNVDYPKDVLLVKNVKYIKEEIIYYDV